MGSLLKKTTAIYLAMLLLVGMGIAAAEETTEETWLTDEKWGFETDAGWNFTDGGIWDESIFLVEDANAVLGGEKMLKLWADGGIDYYSAGVQTSFYQGVEEGKTYAISGFLRTEGMALDSIVRVGFYYGAVTESRKIEEYTYSEDISEWTGFYFSPTQNYKKENGEDELLYIKISLEGAGIVYADEVRPVKSDNLAINGGFNPIYAPTIEQNKVFGWTCVSGRGSWGENWFYDETYGCMRHEKRTNTWPHIWLPASPTNKMQTGEIYKISLDFKTDGNDVPLFRIATGTVVTDSDAWLTAELTKANEKENGFATYEGYFTLPPETDTLGYVIMGSGSVSYYDNLSIEKAKNEAPVFTYLDKSCQAFWPGDTIKATATVLAEGNESAWMIMVLRDGKQMEAFEVQSVTLSAGINRVTGSMRVPKTASGDTLEAYCWKSGSSLPLTAKSVLVKSTEEKIVVRSTAIDEKAWGFETNSLGGEDDGKDWSIYEINRRTPTSYSGIANTIAISKGTASLVSLESEPTNVKEGTYAAKLVGKANTMEGDAVSEMSFVGIGRSYTQLAVNSGKQQTIEGYMKINSLATDARVRLVMRYANMKAETREIGDADLLFAGSNTQGITMGEWVRVQLTVPTVQPNASVSLGLELVGEGTVYFDGFRLLEDTNLVTNGSFAIGYSNNFASNYQRAVYGWSAQQGTDNNTDSYKYNYKYDPTYACAYHVGGKDVIGYLYQSANAFNTMVPGQTYEISMAYHGSGKPTVIIGDTEVILTDSGKTTVRGTGDAAKTFTVYTGEYYLPDSASVPTEYKVSSVNEGAVSEYFADLTIYAV